MKREPNTDKENGHKYKGYASQLSKGLYIKGDGHQEAAEQRVSIGESAVRKSGMSQSWYRKRKEGRNRNTTLLLRREDRDFTRSTRHRLLRPERTVRRAPHAWVDRRSVPRCRRYREVKASWGLVTMVSPLLVIGSGDGPVHRP